MVRVEPGRTAGRPRSRPDLAGGREALLRATHSLVSQHGYHKLTVGDICREAGVVRATFYVYFASKRDAFVRMMEGVVESLYGVAGTRYPGADEYARIVLANHAYLRAWGREREVLAEWFALALVDAEVGQTYERFRRRFEERIEGRVRRLMETGRIPRTDAALLTMTLAGMVESFVRRFLHPAREAAAIEGEFPLALQVISEAWYRTVYAEQPPAFEYVQVAAGK